MASLCHGDFKHWALNLHISSSSKDIRPWWSSTRKFNTLRPRQKGQHFPDDVFIHRKLTWYYVVASVIRRDKLFLKPILTETTDTLTKIRIFEFSWDSPYFTSNKVATIWRRMADIFRIQSDPHGVHTLLTGHGLFCENVLKNNKWLNTMTI